MIIDAQDAFSQKMAELLISKMTHDLAGPIGATENGLELLEEDGSFASDALAIARQSARNVSSRLRYYRLAYGSSSACQTMDPNSIKKTVEAFFGSDRKVEITFSEINEILPKELVKGLLNMILCAKDALMYGGKMHIDWTSQHIRIALTSVDPAKPLKSGTLALVEKTTTLPDDLSAYTVQAWYTGYYAFSQGMDMQCNLMASDRMIMVVHAPKQ
jgi:histidine phosphotransferase ChpT